ncbi:PE_PGRS family protein, partial [Mycolicibacterium vaccae ATCC 25954]
MESTGRHRAQPAPGVGRYWLAVGTGGAAVVGLGVLAGLQSEQPATSQRAVQLASFDPSTISNSTVPEELWLFGTAGSGKRDRPAA